MKKYVVRIVLPEGLHGADATMRVFLEVLHRQGVIQIHRNDVEGVCFDMLPPADRDSSVWADAMAAEFTGYGFNAVRAPACPRD